MPLAFGIPAPWRSSYGPACQCIRPPPPHLFPRRQNTDHYAVPLVGFTALLLSKRIAWKFLRPVRAVALSHSAPRESPTGFCRCHGLAETRAHAHRGLTLPCTDVGAGTVRDLCRRRNLDPCSQTGGADGRLVHPSSRPPPTGTNDCALISRVACCLLRVASCPSPSSISIHMHPDRPSHRRRWASCRPQPPASPRSPPYLSNV